MLKCPLTIYEIGNLSSEMTDLYERSGHSYEYGLSWSQFTEECADEANELAKKWWAEQTPAERQRIVEQHLARLEKTVAYWKQELTQPDL